MSYPPTEHVGAAHPNDWRLGSSCAVCADRLAAKKAELRGHMPYTNIERLKADNAGHYTQKMIADEIFDHARESGRDIQQVR